MTNRENIIRALRRDNPEKVPFEFTPSAAIGAKLKELTGTYEYWKYFGIPMRFVGLHPTKKKTDFSKYFKNLPQNAVPQSWSYEWGVMGVEGDAANYQEMLHPMAHFESLEEIEQYPFPDYNEDYRWEGLEQRVREIIADDLIVIAGMQTTIFETAWYLRGMDNFLVDMMTNEEFAGALMDKITDIRVEMAKRYAKAGVDILELGDDVATQLDMMMNPEIWRNQIKPRLARVVKAAKSVKPDILVFYHGDGNMQKIIPDMIEIGIDVLNPIQPECMDPVEIKKLYGDRLSFWGTLGTQTTMPFGTPEDVRETCRVLIEKVGKGGGLVLAPTHVVEPDVPVENLLAFIEAVKKYGKY